MKKIAVVVGLILSSVISKSIQAQMYMTQAGQLSFFSETPVENIDAISKSGNCILNTESNKLVYSVTMTSFKFEKPLMQEHFNEKYVESDKYPKATFNGKINETIDYTKDGEYPVTATGALIIHGVEKQYTEKGALIIKNGEITINGTFNVKLTDHKIEVPKLVASNIGEMVKVTHNFVLKKFEKKQ
ncbi:MAG: YceI family protein [Bacteroidetes bacterium]|nr:YceI family protein [Bacteroidota bacterium]